MMKTLVYIINGLVFGFYTIFTSSKILREEINYKSSKFWISFILYTTYIVISYMLTDSFVRVILSFLILCAINLLLFQIEPIKALLSSFITFAIVFVTEIFYVILITIIFNVNGEQLQENFFTTITSNTLIAITSYCIISMESIRNFFCEFVDGIKYKANPVMFLISLLALSALSMLLYLIYFDIDITSASILCMILLIIFSVLTLYVFKEKNDNIKLQMQYDVLAENLQEYEKMYQVQKIVNHEVKNELSTVRELVGKDNKKLQRYLDELIDIKFSNKVKWLDTLKLVQEPTLRGLLYYKMQLMDHAGIEIEFELSRNVTYKVFNGISEQLYQKTCRVLGVYLDNAMQAVENLHKKIVRVEIYLESENEMIIMVTNNFEGKIEIDKIGEGGYSSKGIGRGIGLLISKDTIEKEPRLSNETQIIKNYFVQKLKIKLENKSRK